MPTVKQRGREDGGRGGDEGWATNQSHKVSQFKRSNQQITSLKAHAFKIKCLGFFFFSSSYLCGRHSDYMKQFQSGLKDGLM